MYFKLSQMSFYNKKFNEQLFLFSIEKKDVFVALNEWKVTGYKSVANGVCICTKKRLKTLYIIKNLLNDNVIYNIGCDCIKKIGHPRIKEEIKLMNEIKRTKERIESETNLRNYELLLPFIKFFRNDLYLEQTKKNLKKRIKFISRLKNNSQFEYNAKTIDLYRDVVLKFGYHANKKYSNVLINFPQYTDYFYNNSNSSHPNLVNFKNFIAAIRFIQRCKFNE